MVKRWFKRECVRDVINEFFSSHGVGSVKRGVKKKKKKKVVSFVKLLWSDGLIGANYLFTGQIGSKCSECSVCSFAQSSRHFRLQP